MNTVGQQKYRIGVDIGGTGIKIGVIDGDFKVVKKTVVPTRAERGSAPIVEDIINACRSLTSEYDVIGAGIGSAGEINPSLGMVVGAGNLPFVNEPVAVKLSDALGMPVGIDNDGNCALIGERAAGICKGLDDVILLTVGTGIGGAIMIGGKIYRGHNFRAGELGHFTIDIHGEQCECGLYGCYEHYASVRSLIRLTEKAAVENPQSTLAKLCTDGADGKTAFTAASMGCPAAKAVLKEYSRLLSVGINSLVKIFQPEMIVLSGSIAREGQTLLDYVNPHLVPEARVMTTALAGDGGLIGAALVGTDLTE